ncbi:MAG: hypothetical protein ACYTFG_14640 [Planctomycetota bacterium]|jgi:hypothetical protein
MSAIVDTLQTLERIMEYKKASYDICMAAARHAQDASGNVLVKIAQAHDEHLKKIPVIFKHLQFGGSSDQDSDALTEIRSGLFQDVGSGQSLNLVGAVLRVEKEALRLLQRPLEKATAQDLKSFLETVVQTAKENIELLGRIASPPAG